MLNVLLPMKLKKVVDVNYKFQNIWVVKMPWTKPIFNDIGLVFIMRCHVCTKIEKKEKKYLVVKQDFIEKMQVKGRVLNGKWIMDPKCMHVKNETFYIWFFTTIVL